MKAVSPEVSAYFSELGKRGSRAAKSRAAQARSDSLTPAQRSKIAKKAAKTRWAKKGTA